MPRTAAFLLCPLLWAVALVGCGGAGGDAGADPSEVVPASAIMYVEATLRPDGEVREGALDAAGKILDSSDPGRKLRELVDKAIAESDEKGEKATYTRDIEPWLGRRAGLWVDEGIARNDDAVGAVLAVEDAEEAQDFLERETTAEKKATYRGVDYRVDEDETAWAVTDGRLLVGHEPQFKRMIDVLEDDAATLAATKTYDRALSSLSDERLGHFYMDVKRLIDLALAADPSAGAEAQMLKQVFGGQQIPPVAVALLADAERVAFEAATEVPKSGKGPFGIPVGGETNSKLMGELPGDAWAAAAIPDLGQTAKASFQAVAGAFGGAAIGSAVREQTGLDLQEDVFSWIGDVALFVRGTSLDALEGGLVIEATDPAKAEKAFGRISGLLARAGAEPTTVEGADSAFAMASPELPAPMVLARSQTRVVAAVGEQAASDALSPDEKLEDSDLLGEARESLGGDGLEPQLVVAMPQVLQLVEALGAGSDAGYKKAKPYLDAFTALTMGTKVEGDESTSVFSLGLE